MQKLHIFLFLLNTTLLCEAQSPLPYTLPVYSIRKDSAVSFGADSNYCGRSYDLKMNIYKPVGDGNTQRPLIIFVHGGAFTSGEDFNEYNMNAMAMEFAKRGYVAASINYREGHHLYPYGIGLPAPIGLGVLADWTANARLFVSDSAEVVRSLYRAQQDTKAAIRKLKERHLVDSSSLCKVFLGGHSAGGITVMAATFMDQASEKPILSGVQANAPNPNWVSDGFDFFGTWVVTQINGPQDRDDNAYRVHNPNPYNYEAASCYTRPDLGPIDGTVNTAGGYDAKIMGVAALAGAVIDTNVFAGPRKPAVFMYHIPNDMVVPYNIGRPFSFLNDLLTPAPNGKWPVFFGSYWMEQKLKAINYPAAHHLQVYDNGGDITNSHDLLPNPVIEADSVAQFFARVMDTSTACGNIILAISTDFTAKRLGNNVLLSWNAADASVLQKFVIERSADGNVFSLLAEIPNPAGSSFSFTDTRPLAGINYYRLKEVYKGGRIDHSPVRTVRFSLQPEISIFPNPAKDMLHIQAMGLSANQPAILYIYDMQGRIVLERSLSAINAISLPLSGLASGQYNLRLLQGSDSLYKNLIISK